MIEIYKNLMKNDLRSRQGKFKSEVLRIQNLTKSSQAMSIPGTAGEAAEDTFRSKRYLRKADAKGRNGIL